MDDLFELGSQIDLACDAGDATTLQRLGQKCREMLEDAIGEQRVLLRYYEANSHAGIYAIKSIDTAYAWGWSQPETIAEVLALRQAIREPALTRFMIFSGAVYVRILEFV